ncbi:MAG: amino acid ABC transporter permease [Eubacteriales bacterium]|mgnify:FL=1|jgi:amino ABC transporter, permease protein, 3-TM region, his/glu/gln/arg/opine family|nr:amino acid ABC transporter permease [Clostridia bacterium]MDY2846313.1 amino acid ABC transporter permease [Eubacteriales bacterium]
MFVEVTLSLFEGFGKTLLIFALTLAFSVPLGLLVCFGSMSKLGFTVGGKKICPVSIITKAFVWIIRGTPLMLQLIVIYYGPGLLFHTDLMPRFTAVLVAFVVNYAAYFSEIYRGGIESVPGGQYEACAVLGMTKAQTFFRVILMQVVKRIIPPMSNEIITLVKDTSLARVIAVYEIIWSAQAYIKLNGLIWPLFYTGAFYLAFSGLLTLLLGRLEKKLGYFKI